MDIGDLATSLADEILGGIERAGRDGEDLAETEVDERRITQRYFEKPRRAHAEGEPSRPTRTDDGPREPRTGDRQ